MDASTQTLRHELDAALADLEEAATLGEINQTLVDMLDWMKSRKAEAQAAPVVNVTNNVSPTPITNVVNVQRGGWSHTFDYDAQDRIVRARSIPLQPKAVNP